MTPRKYVFALLQLVSVCRHGRANSVMAEIISPSSACSVPLAHNVCFVTNAVNELILSILTFNPFTPEFKKYILLTFEEKCLSELARIGSIVIFHLNKR